ncbi:unnamed protein product [Effrenium voratum]|nr:unnamed protein product [Effrenium voratum]
MYKRKVLQFLSKYIRGLNSDQVSSRLFAGEVELRDAELEVEPLNSLLAGILPYTVQVLAVSCDKLLVQVPWSGLRTRPVHIRVGHMRAQVRIHSPSDVSWAEAVAEATFVAAHKKPASKEQQSYRLSETGQDDSVRHCLSAFATPLQSMIEGCSLSGFFESKTFFLPMRRNVEETTGYVQVSCICL